MWILKFKILNPPLPPVSTLLYYHTATNTTFSRRFVPRQEEQAVHTEAALDSRYVAVFDPLDGSSNIEAAVCTGTIFGVLEDGTVDMKNEVRMGKSEM